MEISKIIYSTRNGEKTTYLPTHDPEVVESIFGQQRNKILSIDPLPPAEAAFLAFQCPEPKQREITDLFQALAQLFAMGVDPIGSLNILIRRLKSIKMSKKLLDISLSIQQGEPIAESFGLYQNLFGETSIHLIRAGSATGNLGRTFENLAENMTKARAIASKVQGALIYPIAVVCVVYIVVLVFCFMVIPKLSDIYSQLGGTLPPITQLFEKLSALVVAYPLVSLTGPVIGFILFKLKEPIARSTLFNKLMRFLPGIRGFIWKKNLTQAATTLALLLESGLPLTEALEFSSRVVSDPGMGNVFSEIRNRLEDGELVNEAFGEYADDLGPDGPRLVMAVEVGDATGNLAPLIKKISVAMEEEFEVAAENLNRLLEPIVILILTSVVGTIVYAIYFPIFTMGQQMMSGGG